MEAASQRRTEAPPRPGRWICPGCGASNRETVEWCGQCFAARPATEPQAAEATLGTTEAGALEHHPAAPAPPAASKAPGAFSVRPEGITWTCKWCQGVNPLDSTLCSVCGASFADVLREPRERPQRDPGTAALVSLFLPGAGHGYVGLWGQAVARGVISAWVLLVALFAAAQGGSGLLLAGVFGLVAAGLWVAAAHDAYREASGAPSLAWIKGRHYLYLVLGLLGTQIVLVLVAALASR